MARHHIRDNAGNLHFFNDQEFFEYKHKGCLTIITILVLGAIGLKSVFSDKKSDTSKKEDVVNVNTHKSNVKDKNVTKKILVTNNKEIDNIATEDSTKINNEINEGNTTIIDNTEENNIEEKTYQESYSESNDESFSED